MSTLRASALIRIAALACGVAAGTAPAQDNPAASPLEKAVEGPAGKPLVVSEQPKIDPEAQRVLNMLRGSFASQAKGQAPALRMNTAPVSVAGLSNALYFEIAREDSPASPFRQGVMHVFNRRGELRLRIFDFAAGGGLRDALAGLWAAPESFPAITLEQLDPNMDLALQTGGAAGGAAGGGAGGGAAYTGQTLQPYPTVLNGAVEMTSRIEIGEDRVTFGDAGVDAEGEKVWGTGAEPGQGTEFRRTEPVATSTKTDEGLVVVTLVPPASEAEKLVEGGQVAVHYTGWLTDGTRFDSSRMPGREPFLLRVPGQVIPGWNHGLKGIAKGERRRLVIPPALAYGERGARPVIPPNATLIFDVEALHVDNTNPQPPQPPPAPPPAEAHPEP